MKWLAISAFLMIVPSIISENVFLLDLTPEEAQKKIATQSLDVKYANKFGENPLPVVKNEKGDFIYQGRSIDNPQDYIEEQYLANQFHGQDGLGRAMFGYADWNQGRLEARNANGDVRGSYQYVDPYGKDIVVKYWSDSLGFHQEDNIPKVELEQVTDSPEVQHAKDEHFRAWKEAAEKAKENPDPYSDIYNRNANKFDEEQAQRDQALEIIGDASNQETLTRYPKLPYNKHINPGSDLSSSGSDDSVVVQAGAGRKSNRVKPSSEADEEATGEPRGFFYNFDYPVQVVRETDARKLRSQESSKVKRNANTEEEAPQLTRVSLKASLGGSIPIAAVHDTQVHPNQKDSVENAQVLPVLHHE